MCEYTQKPRAEQIYLHPLFGDIISEATDARGQYGANCLQPCMPRATVSAARHLYLQMEFDKAIPFALPRREQYMWPSGQIYAEAVSQLKQAEFYGICGKRSAA